MPKEVKAGQKDHKGVLDQHTYPSNTDNMVRNDTPFEGTASSLPPSSTNPFMGADGKIPLHKSKG